MTELQRSMREVFSKHRLALVVHVQRRFYLHHAFGGGASLLRRDSAQFCPYYRWAHRPRWIRCTSWSFRLASFFRSLMIPSLTSNLTLEPTASRCTIQLLHDFNSSIRGHARLRSRRLILFSLIWLSICQVAKGVWCECWHRFHFKEGVGAGRRRLISRGELVSRRLVMLICAGYPVPPRRGQDLSAFFLFTAALVQQSR